MMLNRLKTVFRYPAIWQIESEIDSSALLREFQLAVTGELHKIYPGNENWTGVTVLSRGRVDHTASLPLLRALLEQFGCDNVLGANYFNLAPHSSLHRHRDMNGNLLFGVMRLHIPLLTSPKAIMEVQKVAYHMPVNTLWALDTSGLHALDNSSDQNRIHLVIDVKYSPATAKFFPPLTVATMLHLAGFVVIVGAKVVRDLVTRPASLVGRFKTLLLRITKK